MYVIPKPCLTPKYEINICKTELYYSLQNYDTYSEEQYMNLVVLDAAIQLGQLREQYICKRNYEITVVITVYGGDVRVYFWIIIAKMVP
jgi:hypothetical protein